MTRLFVPLADEAYSGQWDFPDDVTLVPFDSDFPCYHARREEWIVAEEGKSFLRRTPAELGFPAPVTPAAD